MSFIGAAVTAHGKTHSSPLIRYLLSIDSKLGLSQCGVHIGLYTPAVGGTIPIGYGIMKGGTEGCIMRLLLTSPGWIEQKIVLLEHVNCFTIMPIHTKDIIGIL